MNFRFFQNLIREKQVYISMGEVMNRNGRSFLLNLIGLCWGMNSNLYGKEKFPYKEAAVRSIKLWHKLTDARVVMTVVYSDSAPSPPKFC